MSQPSPREALDRLIEGNQRYIACKSNHAGVVTQEFRYSLEDHQDPFAILLCCSDSRVPPEIVFDQSLGALFVVRVAGYVPTDTPIGSIEKAVHSFGSPLLLVMGHNHCAAIDAAIHHVKGKPLPTTGHISFVVKEITKTASSCVASHSGSEEDLEEHVTECHVRATLKALRERSEWISKAEAKGDLMIVGSVYDLHSGEVRLLDQ